MVEDLHPLCLDPLACAVEEDHRPVQGPHLDDVADLDFGWLVSLHGAFVTGSTGQRNVAGLCEQRRVTVDGFWWTGPVPTSEPALGQLELFGAGR